MPEPAAGWFGKIPALGDFASRRLPPEFIQPWDQWLSNELPSAQQALGADWLQRYLSAPAWRFMLAPGVVDARPWCGLLLPSVDRVGRQYPLTFAASFTAPIESLHPWWNTLIEVAARLQDPGFDADALEAELLASQGRPPAPPGAGRIESAAAPQPSGLEAGSSQWWPRLRNPPGDGPLQTLAGLPRGAHFVRLIDLQAAAGPPDPT
jgi:type VI secretion system protein ImpM